tara:strand:- start:1973 stop:2107 length:135 start_codon:yes stop_codon:yes gene_type:complete
MDGLNEEPRGRVVMLNYHLSHLEDLPRPYTFKNRVLSRNIFDPT